MSIHIRTILKAVLVAGSALALSLTLAAAPALAQPAATVFASDPVGIVDCVEGGEAGAIFGSAAGAPFGPGGAAIGGVGGALVGCTANVAIELSTM